MNRVHDRILVFCAGIVLAGSLIVGIRFDAQTPASTKYSKALDVLREFVLDGDHRLGFEDTAHMSGAYVDTSRCIPIYETIIDTLKLYREDTSAMYQLHRTVFPVYVGNKLHSYIVFDSVFDSVSHCNHWSPVMFTNANDTVE